METDNYFWHKRFRQQVGWTTALRRHILKEIHLSSDANLLEVGFGSGALLEALRADGYGRLTGLDIDFSNLSFSNEAIPIICGQGLQLPFTKHSFRVCLCHFYLLWVKDVLSALLEMKRVTRSGGWLIALAEPDFSQRIDKPDTLVSLGKLQTQSLINQGAAPFVGSRLQELFSQLGLSHVHNGVLAPQVPQSIASLDFEMEWQVIQSDLDGLISEDDIARYKQLDREAWQAGTRVLHVPVYFAYGQVA